MMNTPSRIILAVSLSALMFACAQPAQSPDSVRQSPEPRKAPNNAAIQVAPVPGGEPSPPTVSGPAPEASGEPDISPIEPGEDDPAPEMTLPEDQRSPDQLLAAEPVEPPRETRPAAGGTRVFSNKDLERYRDVKRQFGFEENKVQVDISGQSRGTTVVSKSEPTQDLLPEEMDREIESSRAKVNALTRELDHLRKREASLHNPFLPRPEVTDEDKLAEAGMDNVERLDRVKQRIAEIEQEIHTLRNRMAELSQARTSGSTQPR